MAIISEHSCCAICHESVDGDDCFATTHFLTSGHPLWEYSDVPMHWDCFETWSDRPAFCRAYFEFWAQSLTRSPDRGLILRSDRAAVGLTTPPNQRVLVLLAETATWIGLPLSEWESFCRTGEAPIHLRTFEKQALLGVLPELAAKLPDAKTVRAGLDRSALRALRAEQKAEEKSRKSKEARQLRAHQKRWKVARRSKSACPHCANRRDIRAVNRFPGGRSYFICRKCGRSFAPSHEP